MSGRSLAVLLAVCALPLSAHAQVRVGPEFRVNGYTTAAQGGSRVAMDAAGNFLVAWTSEGQDGAGGGVFARWHDADGVPLGAAEFRVNAVTTGDQRLPTVAAAPDGRTVVAWAGDSELGFSRPVYARLYPAAAAAPGPEFLAAAYALNGPSSLAIDDSGNFVVTWQGGSGADPVGAFGRRFNALGAPRAGEFRANTYTTSNQGSPAVASDAAGNLVVAWQSLSQDGSHYGIFAQRYDAAGAAVGAEFRVNTSAPGRQHQPAAASDPEGNFVVVWTSDQNVGDDDIWARRYDAAGVPRGDAFPVNVFTTGPQDRPAVASDGDGGFVVAWTGQAPDGSGFGVFGRRYHSDGTPDGNEFAISAFTTGDQIAPAVAAGAQGDFVATWTSVGQDGSDAGVFAQRFRPDVILRDGFEDGTVDAWSFAAADGGDLSVSPLAGMKFTTAGLQAVVDDTNGVYVQDDRPRDERRYLARFYFDPNGFDPGEAQAHRRTRIFLAFSEAPTRRVAALVLRRVNGEYAIRGRARLDDNTQVDTSFIPITDEPHVIEINFRRATTPTSLDGHFAVLVDGEVVLAQSLDNSLGSVDFVRMGALSVKAGANGTMYWDEFESRRQNMIGP